MNSQLTGPNRRRSDTPRQVNPMVGLRPIQSEFVIEMATSTLCPGNAEVHPKGASSGHYHVSFAEVVTSLPQLPISRENVVSQRTTSPLAYSCPIAW